MKTAKTYLSDIKIFCLITTTTMRSYFEHLMKYCTGNHLSELITLASMSSVYQYKTKTFHKLNNSTIDNNILQNRKKFIVLISVIIY